MGFQVAKQQHRDIVSVSIVRGDLFDFAKDTAAHLFRSIVLALFVFLSCLCMTAYIHGSFWLFVIPHSIFLIFLTTAVLLLQMEFVRQWFPVRISHNGKRKTLTRKVGFWVHQEVDLQAVEKIQTKIFFARQNVKVRTAIIIRQKKDEFIWELGETIENNAGTGVAKLEPIVEAIQQLLPKLVAREMAYDQTKAKSF